METEEIIDVDPKVAGAALREGLSQGNSFVEKLEKMTMLEIEEGDEEEVSRGFEILSKAAARGISNLASFKLSELSEYGFPKKYFKKIGYCAIQLEAASPIRREKRNGRRHSNADEDAYVEEEFEVYEEGTENDTTIKMSHGSSSGSSNGRTRPGMLSPLKSPYSNLPSPTKSRASSSASGRRLKTTWIAEDKWRLGEKIGSGSFGDVFQGMNDKGKLFAVKRLQMGGKKADLISLVDEIDLMRPWIPGGSVAHLLKRFGPFEVGVVRRYTMQILCGLQYLHSHNIVHRDIKGGNILIDDDGTVKLADFGASTVIEMGETQATSTIKGTPYFMAPEVLSQSKYGRKGDIWAVGCTIIQMLSGDPPWKDHKLSGLVQLHLLLSTWEGLPPFKTTEEIPDTLRDCMDLCFRKNPEERPGATDLMDCEFLRPKGGMEDSLEFQPSFDGQDDGFSPVEEEDELGGTMQDLRKHIELVSERELQRFRSGNDTLDDIDNQIQRKLQQRGGGGGDRGGKQHDHGRDRDRDKDRDDSRRRRTNSNVDDSPTTPDIDLHSGSPVPAGPPNPFAKGSGGGGGGGRDRERASSRNRSQGTHSPSMAKLPVVASSYRSDHSQPSSARESEDDTTPRSTGGIASSLILGDDGTPNHRDKHSHRRDRLALNEDNVHSARDRDRDRDKDKDRDEKTPRHQGGSSNSSSRLTPRSSELSLQLNNISSPIGSMSDHGRDSARSRGTPPSDAPLRSARRDEGEVFSPRDSARSRGTPPHGHTDVPLRSSRRDEGEVLSPRGPNSARDRDRDRDRDRQFVREQSESERSRKAEDDRDRDRPSPRILPPVGSSGLGSSKSSVTVGLSSLLSHSQAIRRGSASSTDLGDPCSSVIASARSEVQEPQLGPDEWRCESCQTVNPEDINYCNNCAKTRYSKFGRGNMGGGGSAGGGANSSSSSTRTESRNGGRAVTESQSRSSFSARQPSDDRNSSLHSSMVGSAPAGNGGGGSGGNGGADGAAEETTWECPFCKKINEEDPAVNFCVHCAKYRPNAGGFNDLKSKTKRYGEDNAKKPKPRQR
eukprot:gene7685-15732_t